MDEIQDMLPRVQAYLDQTPTWIVDLQRSVAAA